MLKSLDLATKHSMRCFFNSYVRDMNPHYEREKGFFLIPLTEGFIQVHLEFYSLVGMHEYSDFITYHQYSQKREISFLEAAGLIYEGNQNLISRLQNSIDNMQKMIEANRTCLEFEFLQAEQSLLIGHNMHPNPKSRIGFANDDLELYGPEFRANFELDWVLVKNELIWEERSNTFGDKNWQQEFYSVPVPEGFTPLPVHPWQKKILFSHSDIKTYLDKKQILEGSRVKTKWSSTSSMRSLYAYGHSYMLKFSMSVQMTNSIRHLQEKEVIRGMLIHDALSTKTGRSFSMRFPHFKIMHEPSCLGIKNFEGEVIPETIVLLRENPFCETTKNAVMLSTLNQDHPLHGFSLLRTCLSKHTAQVWFQKFVEEAILPLLIAQADYGVMLGAHQQNLVIALDNGLPSGAWFRDCQGTGFSDLAVSEFFNELNDKERFLPHVIPNEAAKVMFSYYLIINSLMSTINAVARASNTSEEVLIEDFIKKLIEIKSSVKDPMVINYLLESSELQQKGNFRCSVLSINENTTESPLAIYNTFKNPFFRRSHDQL